VVLTHGDALLHGGNHNPIIPTHYGHEWVNWLLVATCATLAIAGVARFYWGRRKHSQYSPIPSGPSNEITSLSV
jgi:hypothetical protein